MNLIDSLQVEEATKNKQMVLLICGTCGFVHSQDKMNGPEKANYLACNPLTTTESRLPSGRLPGDNYCDYLGKACNREDFIIKYGIDPKIYLYWRDAGKPKYKHVCE
jgi:hypothetical protein